MSTFTGSYFLMECGSCGAKNRVAHKNLGMTGSCGSCGSKFIADKCLPIKVTDRDWEGEVIGSSLPVIVEIWGEGCSACSKYEAVVKTMAANLCGQARVMQLNVNENPRTGERYFVKAVPTVLLFRSGKLVQAYTGGQPEAVLRSALGV